MGKVGATESDNDFEWSVHKGNLLGDDTEIKVDRKFYIYGEKQCGRDRYREREIDRKIERQGMGERDMIERQR